MKIDVMCRYSDNKLVVDEYRDILIKGVADDSLDASGHARLNRLRTLSIRNNFPVVLFDTLDDLLLKDKKVLEQEGQEYLKESRAILELKAVRSHIQEDIAKELADKGIAAKVSAGLFEKVFLYLCKESVYLNQILPQVMQNSDFELREDFLQNSRLDRFSC